MKALKNLLDRAIGRREKMLQKTNALRLVNGPGDTLDGLLIDRYNHHIHIQILQKHWLKRIDEICQVLKSVIKVDYLIVKTRRGLHIQSQTLIGDNPETIVTENNLKFKVNLDDGLNCGLFLDMRRNRLMVKDSCKGKKVLNCFAYTCAFGVYARAGGACAVVNTDVNRKVLQRGQVNYALNGFHCPTEEFLGADSAFYLKTALKKHNTFDVIILDPPSFARHKNGIFQVKKDLPALIACAISSLNPLGKLLVSTNYSDISHTDLERMLANNLKGRVVKHRERIGQDEDFCGSNTFKESFLSGLWVELL